MGKTNGYARIPYGKELARAERVAIMFAMEAGSATLPESIQKLIQCAPESFENPKLGKIAVCIRALRESNQPVYREIVLEKSGEPLYIETELTGGALPTDISELEGQLALAAYDVRRSQSVFDESLTALSSAPAQYRQIVDVAVRALGEVTAERNGHTPLTLRRPNDLLSMSFDETDRILGDRLLATGQSLVIAGAGGLGKSRMLLQMAVATICGFKFLGFETRRQDLKWLILQAENSNRRLKDDLMALKTWVGDKFWEKVDEQLVIHTLETDMDGFLSLDNERTIDLIGESIDTTKPGIVGYDSLYNYGIGDLNSDADMAQTLLTISRMTKAGDVNRCPAVLHHALTGKTGAAKSSGWDRASFGRNSKVLHSWTRGQINLAPGSPDNNESLVVTCGKCSNGVEFSPFAIRLNPETMIYEVDEAFNLDQWHSDVSGKKTDVMMDSKRVAELCKPAMSRSDLSKAIMLDCGCSRATSYRHIFRATSKSLSYSKLTDSYNPK